MKDYSVAFMSQKLQTEWEALRIGKFPDNQLYGFILRAIDDLKLSPACGIKIQRKLWPKEYVRFYGITNLWKYNLPNAWRLIYTVETDKVRVVSIILEWFDHKEYDRKFNY